MNVENYRFILGQKFRSVKFYLHVMQSIQCLFNGHTVQGFFFQYPMPTVLFCSSINVHFSLFTVHSVEMLEVHPVFKFSSIRFDFFPFSPRCLLKNPNVLQRHQMRFFTQ